MSALTEKEIKSNALKALRAAIENQPDKVIDSMTITTLTPEGTAFVRIDLTLITSPPIFIEEAE